MIIYRSRGTLANWSWFPHWIKYRVEVLFYCYCWFLWLVLGLVFFAGREGVGGNVLIERVLIIYALLATLTSTFLLNWTFLIAIPLSSGIWSSCCFISNNIPARSWWFSLLNHFIIGFLLGRNIAPCSYIIQPVCQLNNNTFNIRTWIIYQPQFQPCKHTEKSLCFLYSWTCKTHQSICTSVDIARSRSD